MYFSIKFVLGFTILLDVIQPANSNKNLTKILANILLQTTSSTNAGLSMLVFEMLFNLNTKMFLQHSTFDYLNYFELYNKFLRQILLSNPNHDKESFSLLAAITNKNNLQAVVYDFIAFNFTKHIQMCIDKLKSVNFHHNLLKETFSSQDSFYEMNIFVQKVLNSVFELIEAFVCHIFTNGLDFVHYDWSLSCGIWYLLEYLSVSEGLIRIEQLDFVHNFNLKLYSNMLNLLVKYSTYSLRFARQIKFLIFAEKCLTTNYLQHGKHEHVFILNLEHLIKQLNKSMLINTKMKPLSLDEELLDAINSTDFLRTETIHFLLVHIKTLMIYDAKSFKHMRYKSFRNSTLNMLLEKFSFIKKSNKFACCDHAHEINSLVFYCSSFVGPACAADSVDALNMAKANGVNNYLWKLQQFLVDKFNQELDGENFIFKFYLALFERLFEFLNEKKYFYFHNLSIDYNGDNICFSDELIPKIARKRILFKYTTMNRSFTLLITIFRVDFRHELKVQKRF